MKQLFKSPGQYVQGYDILDEIAKYTLNYGQNILYILGNRDVNFYKEHIRESHRNFSKSQEENCHFEIFEGECCEEEIQRILDKGKLFGMDTVVGVGSGKVHDTSKAVGYYGDIPVVIVPTIAASDAPCSSMSVLYTKESIFRGYLYLKENPNLVFVDTKIIMNAPAKLLVAGMGDALSTYFEARACTESGCVLPNGCISSSAAYELARVCYERLLQYGEQAKKDMEYKNNSIEVENIIEANTLLSGIGFESGGLAAAHAIQDGMSKVEVCNQKLHGEKVAFGTLVQLVLERRHGKEYEKIATKKSGMAVHDMGLAGYHGSHWSSYHNWKEIKEVIHFCKSVDLPITLEEFGLNKEDVDTLNYIVEMSLLEDEPIHHMPFEVNHQMLLSAILEADRLGNLEEII